MISNINFMLLPQVFRYALVGGSIATVDLILFWFFVFQLDFPYLWVNAIGFCIGTAINYFMSARWVFTGGIRFKPKNEIILIFIISFLGLIMAQITLFLFINIIMLPILLAKILTIGSIFYWNYFSRKYFVFRLK